MKYDEFVAEMTFLMPVERAAVLRDLTEIANSPSALYKGERLVRLQSLLAPYGYLVKVLRALRMTKRTAYNYMNGYRSASAKLPRGVIEAMIAARIVINPANGMGDFGEWTETIAGMPTPPKQASQEVYQQWVEELIRRKPKRLTGLTGRQVVRQPDEVLAECYRNIERCAMRLPRDAKVREKVARQLIGIIMQRFDLPPGKFAPASAKIPLPRAARRTAAFELPALTASRPAAS